MSTADPPPPVDLARARSCQICSGWGTVATPDGRSYVLCQACQGDITDITAVGRTANRPPPASITRQPAAG